MHLSLSLLSSGCLCCVLVSLSCLLVCLSVYLSLIPFIILYSISLLSVSRSVCLSVCPSVFFLQMNAPIFLVAIVLNLVPVVKLFLDKGFNINTLNPVCRCSLPPSAPLCFSICPFVCCVAFSLLASSLLLFLASLFAFFFLFLFLFL
jgi:hypothetical protein